MKMHFRFTIKLGWRALAVWSGQGLAFNGPI